MAGVVIGHFHWNLLPQFYLALLDKAVDVLHGMQYLDF
jgi:hypothetical protein